MICQILAVSRAAEIFVDFPILLTLVVLGTGTQEAQAGRNGSCMSQIKGLVLTPPCPHGICGTHRGAETTLCWDLPAPDLSRHSGTGCLVKYLFLSGQERVRQGSRALRPGLSGRKKAKRRLMGGTLQF